MRARLQLLVLGQRRTMSAATRIGIAGAAAAAVIFFDDTAITLSPHPRPRRVSVVSRSTPSSRSQRQPDGLGQMSSTTSVQNKVVRGVNPRGPGPLRRDPSELLEVAWLRGVAAERMQEIYAGADCRAGLPRASGRA